MTQTHPLTMKTIPDLATLQAGFPTVKTFLFDMDGTLFDTEKYHTKALQMIGQDYHIISPLDPHALHQLMMGKADHLVYELIKDWPGFPKDWTAKEFVDEKNKNLLSLLSGVAGATYFSTALKNLLQEIKDQHFQLGLVTSSEKVITEELLKLSQLEDRFDFILTRNDTLKVKPDPWPYKKAMDFFQARPQETLVFEDSNVGIEAARASGANVIKVEWY